MSQSDPHTTTITGNSTGTDILETLEGDDEFYRLRASRERQQNLETYASVHAQTGAEITVILSDDADTAAVKMGESKDAPTTIIIPTQAYDQETTDLDREVFDRVMQYAEVIHEIGHVLYTDEEILEKFRQEADFHPALQRLLLDMYNGAEDHAIEEALRINKGEHIAHRLEVKNLNKIATDDEYPAELKANIPLDAALQAATIDLGKVDTGVIRRLLHGTVDFDAHDSIDFIDELDPDDAPDDADEWGFESDDAKQLFLELLGPIEDMMAEVPTLADPEARTKRIFETLDHIDDRLRDEYDLDDVDDDRREQFAEDSTNVENNNSGQAQQQARQLNQNSKQQMRQRHQQVMQVSMSTSSENDSDDDTDNATDNGSTGQPDNAEQDPSPSSSSSSTQSEQDPSPSSSSSSTQSGQQSDTESSSDSSSSSGGSNEDPTNTDSDGDSSIGEDSNSAQSGNQSDDQGADANSSDSPSQLEAEKRSQPDPAETKQASLTSFDSNSSTTDTSEGDSQSSNDSKTSDGSGHEDSVDEETPEGSSQTDQGDNGRPDVDESDSIDGETDSDTGDNTTDSQTPDETQDSPNGLPQDENTSSDEAETAETSSSSDQPQSNDPTESESNHDRTETTSRNNSIDDSADDNGPAAHDEPQSTTDSEPEGVADGDCDESIPEDNSSPPSLGADEYEPDEDFVDRESNELGSERRGQDRHEQQLAEEIEKLAQLLSDDSNSSDSSGGGASGADVNTLQYGRSTTGEFSPDRWQEAVEISDGLVGLLRKQLEEEQRDTLERGRRSGRPDRTRLHRLKTGQTNVMEQYHEGEEKEYSVILVLDRSGSMTDIIEPAEVIVMGFALGLEELGIDVSVIDLHDNQPRIISPFNIDLEYDKEHLVTGETGGGTPLHEVLSIARERLQMQNNATFILSVTDGKPHPESDYLDELDQTQMPVLGITLLLDHRPGDIPSNLQNQEKYYDAHEFVETKADLRQALEQLCYSIAF